MTALAAIVVTTLYMADHAEATGASAGDPTGACCLPDASCIAVTAMVCLDQGGTYQGDGVICDDTNCPILGACCIPFGSCEVATLPICFGELGGVIWAPEQDCASFECPPLGACCRPEGSCQISSQNTCELSLGGIWQGEGVECQDVACPGPCPADIDGSGAVSLTDLISVLDAWGPYEPCPPLRAADIDEDCEVGFSDLLIVLADWGVCPG